MKYRTIAGYVVGHIINDLTASIWFTYTIVYFTRGINLPAYLTGILILIGQLSDGIATPIVGLMIDKSLSQPRLQQSNHLYQLFLNIWPKARKGWHLGGIFLVTISFPFLFYPVRTEHCGIAFLFYVLWAIIFQCGWATVQISHLAMINDLTKDPGERTLLTSIRYFFNVLSNTIVFIGFYVIFSVHKSDNLTKVYKLLYSIQPHDDFNASDAHTFWYLCLFMIGIGFIFSIVFHILVRDSDFNNSVTEMQSEIGSYDYQAADDLVLSNESTSNSMQTSCNESVVVVNWYEWLKITDFWLMAGLYMMTRLIVNISQSYISSYLVEFLHLSKQSIAFVPLTIYLSSIVVTLAQKPLSSKLSREINCLIGVVFTILFCILAKNPGDLNNPSKAIIYSSAVLLGIGCTILLVTNLTMVTDLIGSQAHTSAFVFGAMSFTDKLANGLVIQVIQLFDQSSGQIFQDVEVYGIGSFCTGFAVFLAIKFCKLFIKKRKLRRDTSEIFLTEDSTIFHTNRNQISL